jgi:hypothetical protein
MTELTETESKFRGRPVQAAAGSWDAIRSLLPTFAKQPFALGENYPANPHLLSIVRQPMQWSDLPIPVGVVSPSYALVQHYELGDLIVDCLRRMDLFYDRLRCELEITALGEWATLRFHLGDDYSLTPPDGHQLDLRIEAVNTVDGSGRLLLLMSWFRLVCSNGLGVRDTLTQLADVHDRRMNLRRVDEVIAHGLKIADADRELLIAWARSRIDDERLVAWVDGPVAKTWGKKAAARCLCICREGRDAEFADPFEGGRPSERTMTPGARVPGMSPPVRNAYDAAQALSWIATSRVNVDERLSWQTDIPKLVHALLPT